MMKAPFVYADHILRYITQIEKYIEGYNRETFSKDRDMTLSCVTFKQWLKQHNDYPKR
jgi:hypothetical protein